MNTLYSYWGGSRMYGLPETEKSDWDYYAVGTSTTIIEPKIYPNPKIHQKKRTSSLDVEKVELAAYLTYLMNGFAFQVESLWVPNERIDYCSVEFRELVLKKRNLLIDRARLVDNVFENIAFTRQRTVEAVEKLRSRVLASNPPAKIAAGVTRMRDEYLQKGYYHKDYLHAIRILASVRYFLKKDVYPLTTLSKHDESAYQTCCAIKLRPDAFTRKELDDIVDFYLAEIESFDLNGDEQKFRFDAPHALNVIKTLYS